MLNRPIFDPSTDSFLLEDRDDSVAKKPKKQKVKDTVVKKTKRERHSKTKLINPFLDDFSVE